MQWQCYDFLKQHFRITDVPQSGYKSDKEYFLHVLRDMEIEEMFDAYGPPVQTPAGAISDSYISP